MFTSSEKTGQAERGKLVALVCSFLNSSVTFKIGQGDENLPERVQRDKCYHPAISENAAWLLLTQHPRKCQRFLFSLKARNTSFIFLK